MSLQKECLKNVLQTDERVPNRLAMASFRRSCHHDGKFSPGPSAFHSFYHHNFLEDDILLRFLSVNASQYVSSILFAKEAVRDKRQYSITILHVTTNTKVSPVKKVAIVLHWGNIGV
jgi:hypothetical protein